MTSKWEEPVSRKPVPPQPLKPSWCYMCDTAHEYTNPCRLLAAYRTDIVGDLEVTDATH